MLSREMAHPRPRLYVIPASHPCAAVEAALRLKSISYDRISLLPLTQILVGPLSYGGTTVPGMRLDGERLVGSRPIMRRLDSLVEEPSLLPSGEDPSYSRVLEAERWGDETFQGVPRRLIDVAFLRRPADMEGYGGDTKLVLPVALLRPTTPIVARLMATRNGARDETARADLGFLPSQLEKVDAWITEGLLGGDLPNAADLQIGSTIRLLMSIGDVRPLIEGRPAAQLTRYFPPMIGQIEPGVVPAEWLPEPALA
jgi:glutathione S-transferase